MNQRSKHKNDLSSHIINLQIYGNMSQYIGSPIHTYMYIPYSGKLWQALNMANQSSECIGENFKFGDRERFRIER